MKYRLRFEKEEVVRSYRDICIEFDENKLDVEELEEILDLVELEHKGYNSVYKFFEDNGITVIKQVSVGEEREEAFTIEEMEELEG